MTSPNINPDFYDELELSLNRVWDLIAEGSVKRTSPCHTPVIATTDALGHPQQRVMILRDVDLTARALRFHTDARSHKIAEIIDNSAVSALFYDPVEKVQIRLMGVTQTYQTGVAADAAWSASTPFARRCYMAESAPGALADHPTSGLPLHIEGKMPQEIDLVDARTNFAIVVITVNEIEWLYLANAGHRRAKWQWDDNSQTWAGRWLIP
jgi:pyridoxamine 5'-phosphate oxidase